MCLHLVPEAKASKEPADLPKKVKSKKVAKDLDVAGSDDLADGVTIELGPEDEARTAPKAEDVIEIAPEEGKEEVQPKEVVKVEAKAAPVEVEQPEDENLSAEVLTTIAPTEEEEAPQVKPKSRRRPAKARRQS